MLFPSSPQSSPLRVAVTGAGIVSALGIGWKPNADGFRAGKSAFRPVSQFDVSRQRVRTAAEVDLPVRPPGTHLTPRQIARLDRAGLMLLLAAREAWREARWDGADDFRLILGTTAGGMAHGEEYFRQAIQSPHRRRQQSSRAILYQPQVQGRMVLEALGCGAPITIVSNACASGTDAVGQGWDMIRRGHATRVLAGGHDALCQMVFSGFDALQLLSPTTCRPFDTSRDGTSLGEGAGVIALESLDHARRRGAQILGEVIGYASTMDLHHLTQPHPNGDAALAAMTMACDSARVTPADIDYINAHGTGTPLNDASEAVAIARWAGVRASTLPVSSTKACIGHLLGASGAVEAVVCLMVLREQWLPPETGIGAVDPACAFPIVRQPQEASVKTVLSNSFGFGGVNSTLVFRRWS